MNLLKTQLRMARSFDLSFLSQAWFVRTNGFETNTVMPPLKRQFMSNRMPAPVSSWHCGAASGQNGSHLSSIPWWSERCCSSSCWWSLGRRCFHPSSRKPTSLKERPGWLGKLLSWSWFKNRKILLVFCQGAGSNTQIRFRTLRLRSFRAKLFLGYISGGNQWLVLPFLFFWKVKMIAPQLILKLSVSSL